MRKILLIVLLVLMPIQASFAAGIGQTRYRWVDDQGRRHLSDEVPSSAARFGYDVLNQYGRVIRHVDGAKTPEELEAQKLEEERQRAQRERERSDQNLLLTYPSEADLVSTQASQEEMTQQRIESTRINMKSQLDSLAGMLEQAAQMQQTGKPVPPHLSQSIDKQRDVIREQRDWIERTEKELEQIRVDNAATLERYRAASAKRDQRRSPARAASSSAD